MKTEDSSIIFNTINEAIEELKSGRMIIVCDDKSRENEGDLVILSEYANHEMINFMITHAKGLVCMPITEDLASKLELEPMVRHNTDNFRTNFTVSVDHISNTTGISAFERADTIASIINPNSRSTDFRRPGHLFPIIAKRGGVLVRPGHTEAAIDLAKLCNSQSAVVCEIINNDGTMARRDDLMEFAAKFKLKIIDINDLIDYRKIHDILIKQEVVAKLPTEFGLFDIYGYSNTLDNKEHIAIVKHADNSNQLPLVRIHSECLTGDVFHSIRCDCCGQLHIALQEIQQYGFGAVIYLRQEGRGIGLLNKLKAYNLQDEGLDTVDANIKLGFDDDMRDYCLAAQILKDLQMTHIDLMTNNPDKITSLTHYGICINNRIPIVTDCLDAKKYMDTKRDKMKHLIPS